MNITRDLRSPRLIYLKGALFVVLGLTAVGMLLVRHRDLQTAAAHLDVALEDRHAGLLEIGVVGCDIDGVAHRDALHQRSWRNDEGVAARSEVHGGDCAGAQ